MTRAAILFNLTLALALAAALGKASGQAVPEGVQNAPLPQPEIEAGAVSNPPATASYLETLLGDLARPDNQGWKRTERQLQLEWSKSGSAAMDLLLKRGRDALRDEDVEAAVTHFSALTDHAPEFAEGWNARATALFHAGLYGPAVQSLARALALNPHHYGALAGMGAILAETGDTDGALRAYGAALSIHPHHEQIKEALSRLEASRSGHRL